MRTEDAERRDWWLDDLPPFGGWMRLAFYGLLLVLSLRNLKSPLAGLGFYAETDPRLFQPYGLLEWLGVGYLPVPLLQGVVAVTAVAWVASAIGLGGRSSPIVTAAGALLLHGMFLGSNALNHYYFLPVYTLAALCFAAPWSGWSTDRWLSGKEPEPRLASTGFARKLVLCAAVGFYFAAGMAKLFNGGLAWADGESILHFCRLRLGMYPLADLMLEHPWLARAGAVGALALEVGSPLALVSRVYRHAWVLGLIGMHAAIRYAMGPAYWPNVLCLLLLVDWGWVASGLRSVRRPAPDSVAAPSRRLARLVGSGVLATALYTACSGLFWWPLTNVYMYCTYYSDGQDLRSGYPRLAFYRAESVQRIARHYQRTQPPREVAEYFGFRVALRLAGDGVVPHYVYDGLGVPTWKQLVLTITTPVLIEDLSAKPDGRVAFDPTDPDYPAQRFLSAYVAVLRDHQPVELLRRFDRVELVMPLIDSVGDDAGSHAGLPQRVREEYATLEVSMPDPVVITPVAVVPLGAPDGVARVSR